MGTELDQSRQTLLENKNTLDSFMTDVRSDTEQVLKDISDNRPTLIQTNEWLTDALNEFSENESTVSKNMRFTFVNLFLD